MSGIKVYKLQHPVAWGSETISELKFRRPKGGDLMHINGTPTMEDLGKLASKVSNTEMAVIKELDIDDYMKVMEIVGDFFTSSLPTGANG